MQQYSDVQCYLIVQKVAYIVNAKSIKAIYKVFRNYNQ